MKIANIQHSFIFKLDIRVGKITLRVKVLATKSDEFDLWNPHGAKRKPTSGSCPLASTHTDRQTEKRKERGGGEKYKF